MAVVAEHKVALEKPMKTAIKIKLRPRRHHKYVFMSPAHSNVQEQPTALLQITKGAQQLREIEGKNITNCQSTFLLLLCPPRPTTSRNLEAMHNQNQVQKEANKMKQTIRINQLRGNPGIQPP